MLFNPADPVFWVMIAFFAFIALLLYYRVPGMVTKALDARADAIRNELDEARRLRHEAQALPADYQRKSREAVDEAKAILDPAEEDALLWARWGGAHFETNQSRQMCVNPDHASAEKTCSTGSEEVECATFLKILKRSWTRDKSSQLTFATVEGLPMLSLNTHRQRRSRT